MGLSFGGRSVVCAIIIQILGASRSPAIAQDSLSSQRAETKIKLARKFVADGIPGLRSQAEALLFEAIRIDPKAIDAYAALVRLMLWEVATGIRSPTELYNALELARQVRELDRKRPLGIYLTCETTFALGQPDLANELCESAQKMFPDHIDTAVFQARYLADKTPRKALRAAQKALEAGIHPDELSHAVATSFESFKGLKSQGESLRAFARVYPDRWLWHRAALAFLREMRWDDARDAFHTAIQHGNELESRLQLGILCDAALEDPACARAQFKHLLKAVEQQPALGNAAHAGIVAHSIRIFLKAGEADEAAKLARHSIRKHVDNTLFIHTLVEAFVQAKAADKLVPAITDLAEANPKSDYAQRVLGRLALANGAIEKAIGHYSKTITLAPHDDTAYAARGQAYYTLKRYGDALLDFDRAIALRPDDAVHHYNRACMLAILGNKEESLTSLHNALVLDAKLANAAENDGDFASLRDNEDFLSHLANYKK